MNLKKYYDVNSLFLFWKSFISKQQAFIIILVSVWYKVYFQTVFILIFFKLDWD